MSWDDWEHGGKGEGAVRKRREKEDGRRVNRHFSKNSGTAINSLKIQWKNHHGHTKWNYSLFFILNAYFYTCSISF